MASIEIIDTGRVDDNESAFPQATQLPNGDILCSYSNAGASSATGGTNWSRSTDGGRTWVLEGTLLPRTEDPLTTNFLKVSLSRDGRTVYAYGARSYDAPGVHFGDERSTEAVVCFSTDNGHTWSPPSIVPQPPGGLEISHGILPLQSGRLLAPAATVPPERFGEQVVVAISDDGGLSWPRDAVAMQDPDGRLGYLEQKLAELAPDRLIASAWTVTLGGVVDQPNSYATSNDGGLSWSAPRFIGTMGQTISVVPLHDERVMLLYNRRYGEQGIVMTLADIADEQWPIAWESLMYDARAVRDRTAINEGVAEMNEFAFGFPTALRLQSGDFLATNWSVEGGRCGVRWTLLRVNE